MAGPKTALVEELRHLGGARAGEHAQHQRPGPPGRPPVDRTWISGQAPRGPLAEQRRESLASLAARQHAGEPRAATVEPHLAQPAVDRAMRAMRDAGLSASQFDRAVDLYVAGARAQAAIDAVGGARMSVENARRIEHDVLGGGPPSAGDWRLYFRALDLHAGGRSVPVAIATAIDEEINGRPRPRVEEHRLARSPRRGFPQTAPQRRENHRDNVAAGVGVVVMGAALAGLAWILFGRRTDAAPTPPPQPPPTVKPPARSSQQPPPPQPARSPIVPRPR